MKKTKTKAHFGMPHWSWRPPYHGNGRQNLDGKWSNWSPFVEELAALRRLSGHYSTSLPQTARGRAARSPWNQSVWKVTIHHTLLAYRTRDGTVSDWAHATHMKVWYSKCKSSYSARTVPYQQHSYFSTPCIFLLPLDQGQTEHSSTFFYGCYYKYYWDTTVL